MVDSMSHCVELATPWFRNSVIRRSFAAAEGGSAMVKAALWLSFSLRGAAFSGVTPSRITMSCDGSVVSSAAAKSGAGLLP